MSVVFQVCIPEEERTRDTIKQYYELYLQHLKNRSLETDSSVTQIDEYQSTIDHLQSINSGKKTNSSSLIYKKLISGVSDALDPSPSKIYREYADEGELADHLSSPIGIAHLARSFIRARNDLAARGELKEYHEYNFAEYVAMFDFAIKNGYTLYYG